MSEHQTLVAEFGAATPKDPLRQAMENVEAAEANLPADASIMVRLLAEEDALSQDERLRDRIDREKKLALHNLQMKEGRLNEEFAKLKRAIDGERADTEKEFDRRLSVANRSIRARRAAIEVLKSRSVPAADITAGRI